MKTLGKSIKALREREKWSQADFARKLEVHKNLTYRWENGLSVPHPDHIEPASTLDQHCNNMFGTSV